MREAGGVDIYREVEPEEGGEVVELPTSESRLRNIVERVVRARLEELMADVFYDDYAGLIDAFNANYGRNAIVEAVVDDVRHFTNLLTDRGINLHLGPDDEDFDEERRGEVRGAIAPALQAFLFRARRALRRNLHHCGLASFRPLSSPKSFPH